MAFSIADVLQQANANGCQAEVERFLELADNYGLSKQPKKKSIMIAPPQDKRFALFTIWPNAKESEAGPGKKPNSMYIEVTLDVSVSGTRWDKYFGISETKIRDTLKPFFEDQKYPWGEVDEYRVLYKHVDSSNVNQAIQLLDSLLKLI